MESLFLKILNMSINASWLVLAVLALRLLLKKAPKWVSVLMWGMVGLRLLCPFTLESALSLIPSRETVPEAILYSQTPTIQSGIPAVNSALNPVISQSLAPAPGASVNPVQVLTAVAAVVWFVGMAGMGLYTLISYFRIYRKVQEAVPVEGNVYLCDRIASPFILGLFRPRIYLPSSMEEGDMSYVLAHEKAHLRRKDHWWKPLGFLLLAVHWFNPLLWLGYVLLCRDIELACDEKVIRELGQESKKPYAEALINCSVSRKSIAACPLAFGEVGVKGRIKSVLHYKKPGFWILLAAVTACVVLVACFLTDPPMLRDDAFKVFVDCQIADRNQSKDSEGRACCVDWKVLGSRKKGGETTVYMLVLYQEYTLEGGKLAEQSGSHIPTAITVKKENGSYKLVEYWEPRDGTYYPTDIREKFPWYLSELAINCHWFVDRQEENCENMAWEYFRAQEPAESITPTEPLENASSGDIISVLCYDTKTFDIDGDGVLEQCFLMLGHSSGVFSFVLAAYENGTPEYHNMYTTSFCTPSFTEDEPTRIQGVPNPNDLDQTPRYFDISMDGENICLSENGKALEFWAEQGIDTKFAEGFKEMFSLPHLPQMKLDIESEFIDSATFDIDSDGRQEDCYLTFGLTDRFCCFCVLAFEGEEMEHFGMFMSKGFPSGFVENDKGDVSIQLFELDDVMDEAPHYFEIGMKDGYLVLWEKDEMIPNIGIESMDSQRVIDLAAAIKDPTAPRYDSYGLATELQFQSSTEFDLIFHHDSQHSHFGGTITTTSDYAIRGVTEYGYVIPLEKYIRDYLGLQYEEPELTWDDVVYTIQPDKGLTLHIDLMDTYGELPSGTYWLNKPVIYTDAAGNSYPLQYQITFVVP